MLKVVAPQGEGDRRSRINKNQPVEFSIFEWLVDGQFDEYTDGSIELALFTDLEPSACVSR